MLIAAAAATVPWWSTIAVTLGAILLTVVGNAWISSRQAETQLKLKKAEADAVTLEARRREKVEAFDNFLTAADAAWQRANDLFDKARAGTIGDYRSESRDATSSLTRAYLSLLVVASEPTRGAAARYLDALNAHLQRAARREWKEDTSTPRANLLTAIRAELQ